jgi:hypothetical protein
MLSANWTVDNAVPANVVEVVANKAHTGTNSVHMTFTTASGATFIDESRGFPAPNDSYWGRVWLYAMTGWEGGHHVLIEGSTGVNTSSVGVRPLNTHGGNIGANVDPPDTEGISNVKLPQGVWTCFEWQIAATGGKGNVSLYMNGTEVPGSAVMNVPIPSLVKERIGYERYSAGATGELWIDDYAIGYTRIGCM